MGRGSTTTCETKTTNSRNNVIAAAKKSQNGFDAVVGCLPTGMIGMRDAVGEPEQCKDATEKWIACRGAIIHTTQDPQIFP